MKFKTLIKFIIALFIAIFIINFYVSYANNNNVALIKIDGIIYNSKAQNIISEIKSVEFNPQYKGAIFDIDSPGGGAYASERIYETIRKLSEKKPTVALIESLGASGAYFASCGANKIVAYPASVVGSIGVIFETLNIYKLANKIGIEDFSIKSGALKDAGNPFKKPTKADKAMLQNLVNSIYKQFLQAVSTSRHIPIAKLKLYANGSVFSGTMAVKIGLIDSVGGKTAAKNIIKKMANLSNVKIQTIKEKKSIVESVLGEKLYNSALNVTFLFNNTPKILLLFNRSIW